jgi:hypothetical protein
MSDEDEKKQIQQIQSLPEILDKELMLGDKDRSVIKSHELAAGNFDDMSLKEIQLLTLAISLIPEYNHSHPEETIRIEITRRQLDLTFGANGMSGPKLKMLAKRLQSRSVTVRLRDTPANLDLFDSSPIEKGKEENWKSMVFVPTCEYKNGTFSMTLNQDLNDHFLNLRERFTSFKLVNIMGLSSPYHVRLYEVLLVKADAEGEITISQSRLREMMGLQNKYPVFWDFHRGVIKPAVESINQNTDLTVSYQTIRMGGGEIESIQFFVARKDDLFSALPANTGEGSERDEMILRLEEMGVQASVARKLIREYDGTLDELGLHIKAAENYIDGKRKKGEPVSEAGALVNAIKEKWKPSKKSQKDDAGISVKTQVGAKKPKEEPGIDVDLVIEALESNRQLLEGYAEYLHRTRDFISIKDLKEEGLRSTKLNNSIKEYGAILLKSGKIKSATS